MVKLSELFNMYDSPGSLQDVCVDFICENIDTLYDSSTLDPPNSFEPSPEDKNYEDPRQNPKLLTDGIRLIFNDSEVFLHTEIAEQLLTALCNKKKLNDSTMALFNVNNSRLR